MNTNSERRKKALQWAVAAIIIAAIISYLGYSNLQKSSEEFEKQHYPKENKK